jgi:hypothetical protein
MQQANWRMQEEAERALPLTVRRSRLRTALPSEKDRGDEHARQGHCRSSLSERGECAENQKWQSTGRLDRRASLAAGGCGRNFDGFPSPSIGRVNKKAGKFTIDTLVEMLSRIGKPVKLAVG